MNIAKKPLIICIAVILLTAGFCIYFNISAKTKAQGGAPGGRGFGGNASTVLTVQSEVAKIITLHDYIAANGEIEAQNSVAVYPDIGGKIVSTNVLLGDSVKRGDIIAQIDPSEPGARYALSPVVAPISGSIISTPLKTGTTVTTSSTVTTIGDIRNLQITARIPERYTAVLKTGLKANIVLQAYPDVIFKATVTRVSPVVDTDSRTKEVILKFDESDEKINAGMFATITLYTLDYDGFVAVTNNAVVTKGEKTYIYVIKDEGSVVEQREVSLGHAVNGITQITSGVTAGEKIVIAGTQSLSDGAKVHDISNPQEATDSSNGGKK